MVIIREIKTLLADIVVRHIGLQQLCLQLVKRGDQLRSLLLARYARNRIGKGQTLGHRLAKNIARHATSLRIRISHLLAQNSKLWYDRVCQVAFKRNKTLHAPERHGRQWHINQFLAITSDLSFSKICRAKDIAIPRSHFRQLRKVFFRLKQRRAKR